MPVYAPAPRFAHRGGYPHAMLVIVGAHVALIAAVMSVKMDLPAKITRTITQVDLIEAPKPPPPEPQPLEAQPEPRTSTLDLVPRIVPVPQPPAPTVDSRPIPLPDPGPTIGPAIQPQPAQPLPRADPVRAGPRFATPAHMVEPPYPPAKLSTQEEASLRLKLAIDPRGRVVAVEPVGRVDRTFLEAARRHILANWRYRPATEDGRAIASSTVITLTFRLEG